MTARRQPLARSGRAEGNGLLRLVGPHTLQARGEPSARSLRSHWYDPLAAEVHVRLPRSSADPGSDGLLEPIEHGARYFEVSAALVRAPHARSCL
jgi:hypothetical protein